MSFQTDANLNVEHIKVALLGTQVKFVIISTARIIPINTRRLMWSLIHDRDLLCRTCPNGMEEWMWFSRKELPKIRWRTLYGRLNSLLLHWKWIHSCIISYSCSEKDCWYLMELISHTRNVISSTWSHEIHLSISKPMEQLTLFSLFLHTSK